MLLFVPAAGGKDWTECATGRLFGELLTSIGEPLEDVLAREGVDRDRDLFWNLVARTDKRMSGCQRILGSGAGVG